MMPGAMQSPIPVSVPARSSRDLRAFSKLSSGVLAPIMINVAASNGGYDLDETAARETNRR